MLKKAERSSKTSYLDLVDTYESRLLENHHLKKKASKEGYIRIHTPSEYALLKSYGDPEPGTSSSSGTKSSTTSVILLIKCQEQEYKIQVISWAEIYVQVLMN